MNINTVYSKKIVPISLVVWTIIIGFFGYQPIKKGREIFETSAIKFSKIIIQREIDLLENPDSQTKESIITIGKDNGTGIFVRRISLDDNYTNFSKPDRWETEKLEKFKSGINEDYIFTKRKGEIELRYIKAVQIGESISGVSIIYPMDNLKTEFENFVRFAYIRQFIIWLGVSGLIIFIAITLKAWLKEHNNFTETLEQARDDAERGKKNLSYTLKSIAEGVITTDINGKITKMNKTAISLTGCRNDYCYGKYIGSVINIYSENDSRIDIFNEIIKSPDYVYNGRCRLKSLDNERYIIRTSGSAIFSSNGDILGMVIIFRNITEELQIQNRLFHSQKLDAIGQLASGIAHDFNNIIGGIMGISEILKERLKNDETNIRYLSLITESSLRASELTNNLLTFAQSTTLNIKPLDIHLSISAATDILRETMGKNIIIESDIRSSKSMVMGEMTQLQNIFMNLCINSSHAMPDGGVIKISTRNAVMSGESYLGSAKLLNGEYIEITVEDSGTGIPDEVKPHIFDPFFTTKEAGMGTGLGLSTIYNTIQKLGGFITFNSEVNRGTTFSILIPLTEDSLSTTNPKLSEIHHGVILLIDDDSYTRKLCADYLESMGYTVITAEDGKSGVREFSNNLNIIDMVILDMILPEIDGNSCLTKLKEIDSSIPVVMSSEFINPSEIESIGSCSCDGFISKPFSKEELKELAFRFIRI